MPILKLLKNTTVTVSPRGKLQIWTDIPDAVALLIEKLEKGLSEKLKQEVTIKGETIRLRLTATMQYDSI